MISTTEAGRPLRADAERNRERILKAASEVFADRGLDATLHDVAERAGVGVGTVYRRFPDKEALVAALVEGQLNQLIALAIQASSQTDAGAALVGFLRAVASQQAVNRGLHEVLHGSSYGQERVATARSQLLPIVADVLARAQTQGTVRADIEPGDLPVILLMLSSLAQYTHDARPDAWQRYLDLFVEGLRPHPEQQPPRIPALSDEEFLYAMNSWKKKR